MVRTTSQAWGEKDLAHLEDVKKDPTDAAGPLAVSAAVWSEKSGKRTRLVVAGDSDWASDALIQVGGGNLMLALNSVHWLLSQENRLAIPPKTSVETHLNLTGSQANVLFVLFVLGLPALAAAAGVYVYLRRRR
jgi:LPXTG-motif cell wall-anchored protein